MYDRRVVFIHQDDDPPAGGQGDEEFAEFIAGGNRVQFDSVSVADFGDALGEGSSRPRCSKLTSLSDNLTTGRILLAQSQRLSIHNP